MKTILISLPYAMSARNILRSDVYRILRSQARLVIVTPLAREGEFRKEFDHPNAAFEPMEEGIPIGLRLLRRCLDVADGFFFTHHYNLASLGILKEMLRRQTPGLFFKRMVAGALFSAPGIYPALRSLQSRWAQSRYYADMIRRHKPVLVWLTHTLALEEFPIAFTARRLGIPVIGLIHSWDLLTAKTGLRTAPSLKLGRALPLPFDRVIAWNDHQKRELVELYQYEEDRIFISGAPQFDVYHKALPENQEAWRRRMGLDAGLKIVAFCSGNDFMLPFQSGIVKILLEGLSGGLWGGQVQLLLRAHPGANQDYIHELAQGVARVRVTAPSIAFSANKFSFGWKADGADEYDLACLIRYSDVVINVFSTISIDSALCDKPIVCVGFDGLENQPYYQSVAKYYDFTHYRYVMETGGVYLARSPMELHQAVRNYLADPSLDREGRKKLREQLCYKLDGKSGERIAKFLMSV